VHSGRPDGPAYVNLRMPGAARTRTIYPDDPATILGMTVLTSPQRVPARQTGKRLGKDLRKTWLVIHIVSAGAWIGMDLAMAVLVFTAMWTSDPQTAALCYQVLELFAVWPMLISGVICLISGVALGLGTKYGLVRYWWVAVKLVLNVVLCVLVLFALRSGVQEAAEYGRTMTGPAPGDMIFPPIVSTVSLLFATVISVFKPWGKVRKDKP
jgi:uncharacterized membrane protein